MSAPLRIVPDPPPTDDKVKLRVLGPGVLRWRWRDLAAGEEFEVSRAELAGLASAMAPRRSFSPDGVEVEGTPLVVEAAAWERKLAEERRVAEEQAQARVAAERSEKSSFRGAEQVRRMRAVEGGVVLAKHKLTEAEARVGWHEEAIAQMLAEGAPPMRVADARRLYAVAKERARLASVEVATAEDRLRDALATEQPIAS